MGSRTSSKENILDEPPYRLKSPAGGSLHPHHASRSLDRHLDSDKENRRTGLKARIHVTSPNRIVELDSNETFFKQNLGIVSYLSIKYFLKI